MYADKNFYLSGTPATGGVSSSGTPQAISTTSNVVSTNVFDFATASGSLGQGDGGNALFVEVMTAVAAGGTTPAMTIFLEDSADNSTFATLVATKSLTAAEMTPLGTLFRFAVPPSARRYIRLSYTMTGTSPTVSVYGVIKAYN